MCFRAGLTVLGVDVLLEVLLVAVEVLRAGEGVLEQDHDGQEHLRSVLHVDSLELFQINAALSTEDFVEQALNRLLILETVKEDLAAAAVLGEDAFFRNVPDDVVLDRHVGQNKTHILLDDISIAVEIVQIEGELELSVGVRVVHLEEPVHEFFQINVPAGVQIQHGEEALANDSG